MPLLATSSGQRQFPWPGDSEGDSASDGEGGGDGDVASSPGLRQDNTLSVWWAGPLSSVAEGTEVQSPVVVEAVWRKIKRADVVRPLPLSASTVFFFYGLTLSTHITHRLLESIIPSYLAIASLIAKQLCGLRRVVGWCKVEINYFNCVPIFFFNTFIVKRRHIGKN